MRIPVSLTKPVANHLCLFVQRTGTSYLLKSMAKQSSSNMPGMSNLVYYRLFTPNEIKEPLAEFSTGKLKQTFAWTLCRESSSLATESEAELGRARLNM
jgi:hypothetical protein